MSHGKDFPLNYPPLSRREGILSLGERGVICLKTFQEAKQKDSSVSGLDSHPPFSLQDSCMGDLGTSHTHRTVL